MINGCFASLMILNDREHCDFPLFGYERNRVIQEDFSESISRHFNNVLKESCHFHVNSYNHHLWSLLQILCLDSIGVIDGMHVPAHQPAKDQSRFRNKKGVLSQNILAVCTFDLQFTFIYPGGEGSVADSRLSRAVLDDPDQNFPSIPEGKYRHRILKSGRFYCSISRSSLSPS
ncbi:uncharacterized protein LOC18110342 isoform X1 [Populus trichocarpa]|uniref:uncharacterized protein LOC18110342 isoform X1 n=1 Tax=Populus trichocarpa TaxID=3694 RepID=UPI000D189C5B|nr:uncharacterized protein LOC18110342 isoform X1 [Populus trichocarpa]|eukprot:XP_024454896.1 uncharacterized protein LOC18110342 isoform X1 [Populus trichocarpa]